MLGHPVPIVAPKIEPPNLNKTTNEMMDTFVEYIEVKSSNVGPNILSDIPWILEKKWKVWKLTARLAIISQDILTKVINDKLTIAVMSNLDRNMEIDACCAAMIVL